MNDRWAGDAAAPFTQQPAANDGVTAGSLLRRAREAAGLHVAALAVSLKVPVRKLEALEDDRWDTLTDAVFVRALASSVCRTLKIDPQPVLDRLPQTTVPRLIHDGDGLNRPFRAPSDGAPQTWLNQVTKPVFLAVFALLLGALVLILLPTTQQESSVTALDKADTGAPTGSLAPAPAAVPPSVQAAPDAPRTAALPSVAAAPQATVPAAPTASAPAPVAVVKTAAATTTTVVAAAPVAAASGVVVFRTKGPSWIEVTDAKGVVAMRKLLEAGEAAGASGTLPLQVTIGRVDHTEVQVRGKPFDLRPVSKDNVARFEVK